MARSSRVAELEWVRHAQSSVREAQRLLGSPDARSVLESAPSVERAVECVRALRASLRARQKPSPKLASELDALHLEVTRASALLERASTFYFGWAHLLYAAACGYTARGEPAMLGGPKRPQPGPLRLHPVGRTPSSAADHAPTASRTSTSS